MLRQIVKASWVLLLVAGMTSLACASQDEKKKTKKAPDFQLKDQAGKERSLKELLKKGNVALVFYRSASW